MKRYLIIFNLMFLLILSLISCGKKVKEEDITISLSGNIPDEVEIGTSISLDIDSNKLDELEYIYDDKIINLKVESGKLLIDTLNKGNTNIDIKYQDKVYNTLNIKVIDKVIYLPIPTGKLLLKGIDKSASVKVIITKDELKNSEVSWELDNPDIVSIKTQGNIAYFESLARGKTTVTVKVGNYSNSFILYVTNIRGDID